MPPSLAPCPSLPTCSGHHAEAEGKGPAGSSAERCWLTERLPPPRPGRPHSPPCSFRSRPWYFLLWDACLSPCPPACVALLKQGAEHGAPLSPCPGLLESCMDLPASPPDRESLGQPGSGRVPESCRGGWGTEVTPWAPAEPRPQSPEFPSSSPEAALLHPARNLDLLEACHSRLL